MRDPRSRIDYWTGRHESEQIESSSLIRSTILNNLRLGKMALPHQRSILDQTLSNKWKAYIMPKLHSRSGE